MPPAPPTIAPSPEDPVERTRLVGADVEAGRPTPPMDPVGWRIGAAAGRVTMTVGLLLLAFAAYQLWGTGLREAEAQERLADRLALELAAADPVAVPSGPAEMEPPNRTESDEPADAPLIVDVSGTPSAAPPPAVPVGDPLASIRIPAIDVDKTVVEGTTREALRTGPGHYLGTARPGHPGNVAIAGHRTTYGAPFHDIDQLQPGHEIVIETTEGVFTYRVEAQVDADGNESGHRIVTPDQVEVIADRGDNRLTLTACHPLYSARQRIVVTALLDGPAIQPPMPTAAPIDSALPAGEATKMVETAGPIPRGLAATPATPTLGEELAISAGIWVGGHDDLGWQTEHAGVTAGWAALTALIAAAGWGLGRLWRRAPAYAMATPAFSLALVTCFAHLDRLLPAA